MDKTRVREVLAANLKALMARRPELDTQEKVADKSGVAQTGISQMLRPDNPTAKSPKLTQVEKIASAFGLATWQLLLDPKTVGKEMVELLMRPATEDEKPTQEKAPSFSRQLETKEARPQKNVHAKGRSVKA